MICYLHFVLLVLLCGEALTGDTLRIGPDGGVTVIEEKEVKPGACQCTKSQKTESQIDVIRSSKRIGSWSQGRYKDSLCFCSDNLRVHQQAIAMFKSWLAYLTTHADRPSNTLSERIILDSSGESSSHHFISETPSPSYSSRTRHGLPQSVASPPCHSVHDVAPPNIDTTAPVSSCFPGPSPSTFKRRHRRGRHGRAKSLVPSPALAPGPIAASSPTYRLPVNDISPAPDCSAVVCSPPLTKASFASPCVCVQPIEIELELSVPLYALFPLISVLALELAEGAQLSSSQVEIVGANTSGLNQDSSIVDAYLLPMEGGFSILTATMISRKFWKHEVVLNRTLFGNYTVVYVKYPGLPPPPPAGGSVTGMAGYEKPFGVDISKPSKEKLGGTSIAAIVLSAVIAMVICFGAAWLMLPKCRRLVTARTPMPGPVSTENKIGGGSSLSSGDRGSSASVSFPSSAMTCASTARLFTIAELARATNRFAPENVIGEGGFGRVFSGVLDDGTRVAVKMLTRDNHQGGKEFVAEVEILSRLHHRNLVKLIGICTEEHTCCLVYELIPNGSVESHLHGKGTCALDWETRIKIALGAARGLAYLHEDSSPRVIHRDFKAANILLENDFNPKISDFGLAKVAPEGGKEHLSTRVMGTFGYVAPEYAMTGHLLVKSDVYSYGVVLLELLSGKKPVDMSQPPGQENLVTWARPLLTSMEGLQVLVDPTLQDSVPFDNLAKVAAIASMCVHPEVSDRPLMGEVVQALKLVCNDFDVSVSINSSKCSQEDHCSTDIESQTGQHCLGESRTPDDASSVSMNYDFRPSQEQLQKPFSPSAPFFNSARFIHALASPIPRSLSCPLRLSHNKLEYTEAGIHGSSSEDAPSAVHLATRQGRRNASWHETVRSLDFLSL